MMDVKFVYVIVFLISVGVSSISQVILKLSARKSYADKIREYLNPMVMGAYVMFLGATLLTTMAYRGVPLSLGPVLEATGYVYVAVLGTLVLKEKMTRNKVIGNILIIIGIVVYAVV